MSDTNTGQARDESKDRLRTPPQERFAGDHHVFDLKAELQRLRAEEHQSPSGHRQVTLLHHGPVAQVLFLFQSGGEMPRHSTYGWVTLHVLEGHLTVDLGEHSHDLEAGNLLMFDPQVPHTVRAQEESVLLLTVHIQTEGKPTPLTLGPNE